MLLEDIGNFLQTRGVGMLWSDLFWGYMPDQPDNLVALFEYAGQAPDLHWNGEYPRFQVRVRNKNYTAGRAKIEQVVSILHGLYEQVLGTTRYLLIRALQSPESLGRDANGRAEWVVNFSVIKERG